MTAAKESFNCLRHRHNEACELPFDARAQMYCALQHFAYPAGHLQSSMHRKHRSLPAGLNAVLSNIVLHLKAESCQRIGLSFCNDWR